MRRVRARRQAPNSVHAFDLSLANVLSTIYLQVLKKALTIEYFTRGNDPTRDWQRASSLLIERPGY